MQTYKGQESIIKKYVDEYNRSKIIELKGTRLLEDSFTNNELCKYIDTENKYTYYYSIQSKIDCILDLLDWDESNLLKKEFFSSNKYRNWWIGYYSRSTYYRLKKKAMNSFLELLYA